MKYLAAQFSKIKERLRNKFILLLLDYDGTLTPIAKTPKDAVISKEIKELLRKLSQCPHCALGIISGRALQDIKNAVGIEGIIYAGNHGLEVDGPKIKFENRVFLRYKSSIGSIYEELSKQLSGIKGVLLEDKGLAISVHYRLVDKKDMPVFERFFSEVADPYAVRGKIEIDSGKKVYEIKPPVKWDKGKVVLWLLSRPQFVSGKNKVLPVYIGDDVSDEDAFRALKSRGVTVFVGRPKESFAQYYLKSHREVQKFLERILERDNGRVNKSKRAV